MAYGRWKNQSIRKARVEIIPLIDVMFLLLCFFVYATVNMVVQQGIFVDLASSSTSESVQEQDFFVVSVDEDGQYYLNEEPVSRNGLMAALNDIKKGKDPKTVMVNADRDASHGQVVTLLDLVRRSGVRMAVFSVEPEE